MLKNPNKSNALWNQAALYLVGNLLSRAVGFLMIPVYTRKLTTADYGLVELLELLIQIVSLTIGLGIFGGAMMLRSYHAAEGRDERGKVVSTALLGALLFNTGIVLIAGFASPWLAVKWLGSTEYTRLLQMSFLSMAFANCIEVGLSYLRVTGRAIWFLTHSVLSLVISLSINIWTVVFLNWGVWGIATSKLVVTSAGFIGCLWLVFSECGSAWRQSLVREMFRFGAPLVISNVSLFVIHFGDRFFLQRFTSLGEVGIYSFAYRFAFLITFLVGEPFGRAWNATFYEFVGAPEWKEQIRFVGRLLVVALATLCILLTLFAKDIVTIMAGPAFQSAATVIPIVVCAYGLRELGDFFRTMLYVNRKTGSIGWVGVACAVVNCILNIVLMPNYGMMGAAWSTLLTWSLYLVLLFVLAERDQKIQFPVMNTLLFAAGSGSIAVLAAMFEPSILWTSLLLHSTAFCAFIAMVWRAGYLSSRETRWISQQLLEKLKRARTLLPGAA